MTVMACEQGLTANTLEIMRQAGNPFRNFCIAFGTQVQSIDPTVPMRSQRGWWNIITMILDVLGV